MNLRMSMILIAASVSLVVAVPARAQTAPALTANRTSLSAGEWIVFTGAGFTPNERVSVWSTAPNGVVLGGEFYRADPGGNVWFDRRIADDAIGGRWAMTAYGDLSKTPVIATFDVVGKPIDQAAFLASASPASGPPGTVFSFVATGYDEKERISYWFTGPDGVVYDSYNQTERTDKDGEIELEWKAPESAVRGRWVVTIQGIKSAMARAIVFEIT
jgi:hypothetical protein